MTSSLATAQRALACYLQDHVEAEPIAPVVPAVPAAWAGYVWPANDWISTDEDEDTFCLRYRVSLVADFVAGTTDLEHSQSWLNDRVNETLVSSADGIEVLPGEMVDARSASVIGLIRSDQGSELLVARVEFTPFTLEVSS